jgi:hypothetical protein
MLPGQVRFFGKPNPEPYRLAEKLLVQQALQMGLIGSGSVQPGTSDMDMHSRVVEEQVGSCDHSTYSSSDGPSSRTAAPFSGIYAVSSCKLLLNPGRNSIWCMPG